MFWRELNWIFFVPKRPVSGLAFTEEVQIDQDHALSLRILYREFFITTGKSAEPEPDPEPDPEQGETILPLSIRRLGRRIDQPADCSSHPQSRPQCCINMRLFLFLYAQSR
jgi:hypothetical protein